MTICTCTGWILSIWAICAPGGAATRPAGGANGYSGIWCRSEPAPTTQPTAIGGLGTFGVQQSPPAVYSIAAGKTFFAFGGHASAGAAENAHLAILVGTYDHASGEVSRPKLAIERPTPDPHANPAMMLDAEGLVWLFSGAVGREPGVIVKGRTPASVESFEKVREADFQSPQPWLVAGQGTLLLHTRRDGGLHVASGPNPAALGEPRLLAAIGGKDAKHEFVSARWRNKIGVAFVARTQRNGRDVRANLYYMESSDLGATWTNIARQKVAIPVSELQNAAVVYDYLPTPFQAFVKDLVFDASGNPTILYLITPVVEPGKMPDMCFWSTARASTRGWEITGAITSDHPGDSGCLYAESGNIWRLIAPTLPGPQPGSAGGEVVMWLSPDFGRSWHRQMLTMGSRYNQTYVRKPLDAHADFYAFWADGDARSESRSHLYFATQDGRVFVLPEKMQGEREKPRLITTPLTSSWPATASQPD